MNQTQRTFVCLTLAAAVIVQVLGFAVAKLPLGYLYNPVLFMTTALAISVLAFRRGEVVLQLLVGVALSIALLAFLLMLGNDLDGSWKTALLGFWSSSLLVSGHRMLKANAADRLPELDRALVIVALPLMVPVTRVGLWLGVQALGRTYDNYFYAFDGLLPIPVARILAEFCASHHWAWTASAVVYDAFLLVLCAFIVLQWRHDGQISAQVLCRWIIATVVGYGFYYFLPGVGPDVAFYDMAEPHFGSLPSPRQVELTLLSGFEGQPRNAMPSLHATWAFLVALIASRMAFRACVFGALYAAATAFATLGLREN